MKIKKNDTVLIITGDDKGQQGRVLKVFPGIQKAIVEGLKMVKKHVKPSQKYPKGGIISKESPVHISNLMVIDPGTGEPSRIGRRPDEKTGKLIRFAKKSGTAIR
ncbi:MAG: 50S ribosomal protein L24 [Bacteroidetes bacterium]|nr:50S ribosomal protein L24 [Bacteroidota bacterium]